MCLRTIQAPSSDSVAEGLKSALRAQPGASTLRNWYGLASKTLSLEDFRAAVMRQNDLTCLTIDTTGACDLSCSGMCYYHPGIDISQRLVPEDALQRAVEDAQAHLNLRQLIVMGKEPFLNPQRLFSLIRHAGSIKASDLKVGIVTNGRHVHRHWDALSEVSASKALDFIDISIDSGFPEQHDSIRGIPGTFDLAFSALKQVGERLTGVRPCVSAALRTDNAEGLLELVLKAAPFNNNFCITPIQPPPFGNTAPISTAAIAAFLHRLIGVLNEGLVDAGVEVVVSLHGLYLYDAVQDGFFGWEDLREDRSGQVIFTCTVLPEYGWRLARITYTGAYLSHAHFLQVQNPEKHATGYIQNEPIMTLYERAKERSGLFGRLLDSRATHSCCGRPCWSSCFGGWTVSENSFLTGKPLASKPSLCLKGEAVLNILQESVAQ